MYLPMTKDTFYHRPPPLPVLKHELETHVSPV